MVRGWPAHVEPRERAVSYIPVCFTMYSHPVRYPIAFIFTIFLPRITATSGFTGLVLLHGALNRLGLSRWTAAMLANYHPTYYGMMVANFTLVP